MIVFDFTADMMDWKNARCRSLMAATLTDPSPAAPPPPPPRHFRRRRPHLPRRPSRVHPAASAISTAIPVIINPATFTVCIIIGGLISYLVRRGVNC